MISQELLNKPVLMEDGDYTQDGLIYCHWCDTPKQCRPFKDSSRIVACLCKHRAEEQKREEEAEKQKAHERYINYLRQTAFQNNVMQNWTFENAEDSKIIQIAKNYADNFDTFLKQGKGIIFFGTVGNGKTYASACVCNALIDKGVKVFMSNIARLTNEMSGLYEGKQEYIDNLNNYKLLVIDDLGIERGTEYMDEQVFNIFDARYQSGLPFIITTNLTWEQLKYPTDKNGSLDIAKQRVYDRILERCHPVEVNGESRRKLNLKKDFKEIQSILEGKE